MGAAPAMALPSSAEISPSQNCQHPSLTSPQTWSCPPVLRGEEVDGPVLADLAPVRFVNVNHLAHTEAQSLARARQGEGGSALPTPAIQQTGATG